MQRVEGDLLTLAHELAYGGLMMVGANVDYVLCPGEAWARPFFGDWKSTESIEDAKVQLAFDRVMSMTEDHENALVFYRYIRKESWPSKAWKRGSPMRRIIAKSRRMRLIIRNHENARIEQMDLEREELMIHEILKARAVRSGSAFNRTRKSLGLLSLRHGVTHHGTGAG